MTDMDSSLFQLQADLTKAAIADRDRLLRENAALRTKIDAMPATAWELQERVTQLEMLLAITRAAASLAPKEDAHD